MEKTKEETKTLQDKLDEIEKILDKNFLELTGQTAGDALMADEIEASIQTAYEYSTQQSSLHLQRIKELEEKMDKMVSGENYGKITTALQDRIKELEEWRDKVQSLMKSSGALELLQSINDIHKSLKK